LEPLDFDAASGQDNNLAPDPTHSAAVIAQDSNVQSIVGLQQAARVHVPSIFVNR
jgi:hypothetical protein